MKKEVLEQLVSVLVSTVMAVAFIVLVALVANFIVG